MRRLLPFLLLSLAGCPDPVPEESTAVEADVDLSTPPPEVDPNRPAPADTGAT